MTPEERQRAYNAVSTLIAFHPKLEAAKEEIELLLELGPFEDEAPCKEITGPSGVGKTTLFNWLQQTYPREPDACVVRMPKGPPIKADRAPFMWLTLMEEPNIDAVCRLVLTAYGDPFPYQGTVDAKTDRIDRFIHHCGTVAWFIDEAQFLVDRNGVVAAERIVNWLRKRQAKASRAELRLPQPKHLAMVVFGLGRLDYVLQQDTQIERRWDSGFRLLPYSFDEDEKEDFKDILVAFRDACGIPFADEIDLNRDADAKRFHYATWGLVGLVKKVFKQAVMLAIRPSQPAAQMDWALFEKAFERAVRRDANLVLVDPGGRGRAARVEPMQNPFSRSFNPALPTPPLADDRLRLPLPEKRRAMKKSAVKQQLQQTFAP